MTERGTLLAIWLRGYQLLYAYIGGNSVVNRVITKGGCSLFSFFSQETIGLQLSSVKTKTNFIGCSSRGGQNAVRDFSVPA